MKAIDINAALEATKQIKRTTDALRSRRAELLEKKNALEESNQVVYRQPLRRSEILQLILAQIDKHAAEYTRTAKWDDMFNDFVFPKGARPRVEGPVDLNPIYYAQTNAAISLQDLDAGRTAEGQYRVLLASESSGVILQEGVNMTKFNSRHSWRERHSEIILKGQVPGDDQENGAAAAHLKASSKDAEIDRYRPLVVIAEHGTSNKSLADRAAWEVKVRMGRGKRGGCTVVGWRTGKDGQEGPLWQPNTLVHVTSERMNIDRELLIVSCSYQFTEQGSVTDLTFARPEAFQLVEGIGRSKLNAKLSDKIQKEKKQKGDGFTPPWELSPPNPRDKRGAP